jgi:hypothetical protein
VVNSQIAAHPEYQTIFLHTGDWVYSDTDAYWASQFFSRTSVPDWLTLLSTVPVMGARGNHEGTCTYYIKYYPYNYQSGGKYYSYDYGPVHVAVVDQYTTYTSGSAQYNWLQNDLQNSGKKWKIIVLHEPAYSDGGGHIDNTTAINSIVPLANANHVSMIMGGHNHYYARIVRSGSSLVHLTLGGGGASAHTPTGTATGLVSESAGLSFLRIDISGDNLNAYAYNNSGAVIDNFALVNATSDINDKSSGTIDLRVIPNPSCGTFDIYSNKDLKNCDFEIYNLNGQLLKKVHNENDSEKTSVEFCEQAEGTYILKTIFKNTVLTTKVMLLK